MNLKVKKLDPRAKVPVFALHGDAGMDLFSIEDCIIKAGQICQVRTGIAMEFPQGYVALIWDKSGLANKFGLKTLGGVFDSGYRGEYIMGIVNLGKEDFKINLGDKIAQVLIQKIEQPIIEVVEELTQSVRGGKRHGSTGK